MSFDMVLHIKQLTLTRAGCYRKINQKIYIMKTILFWLVFVAATVTTAAQYKNQDNTQYGLSMAQFSSESGFQPGFEIHFTVQPSRTSKVGFGLFMDNETKRISGLTITHQRMLVTRLRKLPLIQPFVVYNFIYRRTSMQELIVQDDAIVRGTNLATYASMEHHLGLGLNLNFSKRIYLDASLGYGLYLGSIKRPSTPDPITRQVSGSTGGGLIFKTGIGIRF